MPSLVLVPVAVSEESKQTDRIVLYILDKSMYDAVVVITCYVHRSKGFK